jgi:hypothetical protein
MDLSDDRFMRKNLSMAKAFETGKSKAKTVVRSEFGADAKEESQTCYNCKTRQKCDTFRRWRTGGVAGVVSVNADHSYWCDKYVQDPVGKVNEVSQKQVRSLLRGARKGLI